MQIKHKVLIVDDEEDIRNFLSYFFQKKGCEAVGVESAALGLKILNEESFDCLISDIKMPGMDGLEFSRRARALRPELPIIMLTGFGSLETAQESIRTGVQAYFTKPVDCDRLYSAMEESVCWKEKERVASKRCHQLEEELKIDKQKLDSMKEELTTLITHELRTPVAVISESFSLLKDATSSVSCDGIEAFTEKEKKRLFEFLERGHRRLVTVIEDISYFIDLKNHVAAMRKSEVFLNDFLEGCFAAFERLLSDTRATLKKRFNSKRLSVKVDKEKFLDCLARIIYNAAHNNPEGVEISLKLSRAEKNGVSFARVEVCDDGKGIEESKLKHLFDPFTVGNIHQHDKGIGLGLVICNEVIKLHDGDIRVNNQPSGGVAVAIDLPLVEEDQ